VPNREIVNINYLFTTSAIINLVEANYILEDINIDELRDKFIFLSRNMLRALFTSSKTLSVPYIK